MTFFFVSIKTHGLTINRRKRIFNTGAGWSIRKMVDNQVLEISDVRK